MINFLITTDLTTEQLDYVHTVQQSADALLLVINDILDLSKVEAGMMKLEMEPFSVHTMIEGANELLSTLAIQKGLELGFLVENEVPEVVIGDRVRLRQVLINIIGVSTCVRGLLLIWRETHLLIFGLLLLIERNQVYNPWRSLLPLLRRPCPAQWRSRSSDNQV